MKLQEIIQTKAQRRKEKTLTNPEPTNQKELLKNSSLEEDKKQIISALQKECGEVLRIYKKVNGKTNSPLKVNYMFRGERSDASFFKNSIWVKRKPKFLDPLTHDASVNAFTNLGLNANRENAIFCARYKTASHWGNNVYLIFPTDGYEITWFDSPKVGEYMYDKLERAEERFVEETAQEKFPKYHAVEYEEYLSYARKLRQNLEKRNEQTFKEFTSYVEEIIKEYNPVSNELERALTTIENNEFLVSGNAYYGLSFSWLMENQNFIGELFKGV